MSFAPAVAVHEPHTIGGHPAAPLVNDAGDTIQMITLCAECGTLRSIIMLVNDRFYCSACRAEGNYTTGRKMFPIS